MRRVESKTVGLYLTTGNESDTSSDKKNTILIEGKELL